MSRVTVKSDGAASLVAEVYGIWTTTRPADTAPMR